MIHDENSKKIKKIYSEIEGSVDVRYLFGGKTFQQFNNHPLNYRKAMSSPIHRWFEYKEDNHEKPNNQTRGGGGDNHSSDDSNKLFRRLN